MIRWWTSALQLLELFVSSVVHLGYGFYIFSSAVAGDLSQALSDLLFKPNLDAHLKAEGLEGNANADDLPPIVLVHGIFGFGKGRLGGLSYFAGAEKKDDRVLVPDLGSLTSIYDRARELFYYLKGGQVDYGEEHSKIYGHSQFGRVYDKGHYPEWDEDHPIHFVGHSAGAQVVRVLQQMLADKEFEGYEDTSADWILSITSLSGAFNGTTRTYLDGMQPEDGKSLKPICLLQLCRIGVIIYDWFDVSWLKAYYNFGFDHFNMSRKKMSIRGLIDCLMGNAGPFASGDWILPDLTIQGSVKLNSKIRTHPNTYYFSYATKRTRKIMGITVPSGLLGIHPLLFIRVLQMSQWRLPPDIPLPYKGYRDEDWWDNDGALNTISMTHPRIPIEHPSHFVVKDSECQPLQPGIWYYKIVEGDHILFIVNRERAGVQFDLIYDSIFERCRKHVFRRTPTIPDHGSLDALNGLLKEPVPINRFRPNILVDGCEPFSEDLWMEIKINKLTFNGVKLCSRCKVPTINQETAVASSEPIDHLKKFRSAAVLRPRGKTQGATVYFGQNMVCADTLTQGKGKMVKVGDPVFIQKMISSAAEAAA